MTARTQSPPRLPARAGPCRCGWRSSGSCAAGGPWWPSRMLLALPWILVGAFELGGSLVSRATAHPGWSIVATAGRAQLRGVQLLRLRGLPARRGGGPVLRGHRGQRGGLGIAAVPARRAGAPGPAAAPEARRGAGLLDGRGDQLPADVTGGGHGGVRLASAAAARHRVRLPAGRGARPDGHRPGLCAGHRAGRWPGWRSCSRCPPTRRSARSAARSAW